MASKNLGQLTLDLVANIGGFTGPLDKAQREADKRAKEFARTQRGNERAINNMLRALDKEVAALGKTAKEQKLMELATRGATQAQQTQARAAYSTIEAYERQQERMEALNRSVGGVATQVAAAAGAFLSITAGYGKIIRETIAFENEQAQLAAALKSTGEAAGFNQKQLNDMAAQMASLSTFSGGELNQAQTNLLTFTGIVGEQFPRALQAAVDMAERTGVSVASASETIGRALDIPSQGLTALSRQGFRFTKEQKALAEELERTGRTAEAQGIILEALEESYGGAAEAARNTLGGALTALQNEIGSLMTAENGTQALTSAINDMTATLADPEVKQAFSAIVGGVVGLTEAIARGMPEFVRFTQWVGEELATVFHGVALDDIVRLQEELERLQKMRDSFGLGRLNFFGRDGIVAYYNDDELDQEISKLRRALEDALSGSQPIIRPKVDLRDLEFDIVGDPFAELSMDPLKGMSEEAKKYIAQLERQKVLTSETTELAKLNFQIQSGALGELTGYHKDLLRARAKEVDEIKAQIKEAEQLNKIRDQADKYIKSIDQQLALLRAETEVEKILYEVQSGRYAMLDQTQKDALVRQAQMLDDARAQIEAEREYKQLIADVMTEEEKRTEQLRERLAVIDAMDQASYADKEQVFGRVIQTSFDTDPEKPDGDGFEAQREALQSWYDEQLEMLEKFRAERADLNAQWDEQEEATRSEYEKRLTEINTEAERDRRQQMAEGFSALLSVAEKFYDGMEGEEAAYTRAALQLGQVLLDEKKRESLEKIIASTHTAAMGAYEALSSIPYIGPVLGGAAAATIYVAGGAAAASVMGMAHDGIDSVPQTGTWLLEKGERVTTAETSAKLDATLDRVAQGQSGGGDVVVNLIEDSSKAGQVNQRTDPANEQGRIIDVFVANIQSDGRAAQAIQNKWGLSPRGR